MNRRGFTLIELMITLVLTGIMAGLAYQAMRSSQQMTRTLSGRVDAQSTARSVMLYMATALRELDASEGDLVVADPATMRYRAMRWTGLTCSGITVSGSDIQIRMRKSQIWGFRAPSPGLDSILLYAENNTGTRADDVWLIASVSDTVTQACPDASAGLRLTMLVSAGSGGNAAATAGFTQGSPMRGFQHEEVSLFSNAGSQWFGHRTMNAAGTWTTTEALVGPLMSGGLTFTYYDTLSAVTATRTNVASIGVIVRSLSTEVGRTSAGVVSNMRDSLISRVALRNNRRF
ncbi:MAG TPA: type II secretion system protein [Gemmatimonadaceae bacterium]|nr:type II secretion system protein [Gemmatimonadaceae bacterium]